jgi:predicted Zn-dependent protease
MKPRAFIGSSVEGLDAAYAIQQNLLHDAECTVWDQSVFELSSTSIESLIEALANSDFAIFVFSPDDETKMRGKESATVRDNVLFELGLFIGRLGRERVFFVVPSGTDMHIPTDLLGVTPGKFDPRREDGKLQAATGPVCNQIRNQVKKLGGLTAEKGKPVQPGEIKSPENQNEWFIDFFKNDYVSAEIKIKVQYEKSNDKEKHELLPFVHYVAFKKSNGTDKSVLVNFAAENPSDKYIQSQVAQFLFWSGYVDDAIKLIVNLEDEIKDDIKLKSLLASCHATNGDKETAKKILNDGPTIHPELAIQLAEMYEESGDNSSAFDVTRSALVNSPSHELLRYKCARYASEIDEYKIAVYLLRGLANEFPKSEEYWGYLANCCVSLDFFDQALVAYRRAESISEGKAEWITSNIGNVLFNRNLPSEAIPYLKKATLIDEESEYAHAKLAKALIAKKDQEKLLETACDEGRVLFRNWIKPNMEGGIPLNSLAGGIGGLLAGLSSIK